MFALVAAEPEARADESPEGLVAAITAAANKPGARSATLTLAVTALALCVVGALVVLTTARHNTTQRSASALASVRLAEEAEIDLLLHERAKEPLGEASYRAISCGDSRLHEAS